MKTAIRTLVITSLMLLMASPAFSGDIKYGIGAGARDHSATIYFPVKTKRFILEPMINIRYYDDEYSNASEIDKSETTRYSLGAGVFMYTEIFKNTDLIYGARLGYIKEEFDSKRIRENYTSRSKLDQSGYFIAPTMGLEYSFNDHVSLGLEFSLEYSYLDGDADMSDVDGSENYDTESTDFSTATDIFIKFYF